MVVVVVDRGVEVVDVVVVVEVDLNTSPSIETTTLSKFSCPELPFLFGTPMDMPQS